MSNLYIIIQLSKMLCDIKNLKLLDSSFSHYICEILWYSTYDYQVKDNEGELNVIS